MACLPRQLIVLEYEGVVKALVSSLSAIGSVDCIKNENGTCTIQTVGIRPAEEVFKLRDNIQARRLQVYNLTPSNKSVRLPLKSKTWELEFKADILPSCLVLHIVIQHSSSMFTRFVG
jgi:beta-fructofuranosidase